MTKQELEYVLCACGCLYYNEQTWYEHNELIQRFEDMGLLEKSCKSVLEDIKAEIVGYLMDDNVEVGLAEIHEIESIFDRHISGKEQTDGKTN